LGSYLRNGRLAKKLSTTKLASEIAVSIAYIKALEEGDYSALPPEVYVVGFIKRYCKVVGLDYQKASYLFSKNKLKLSPPSLRKSLIAHPWFLRIISYRNLVVVVGLLFLTTLLFYLVNVIYPMYAKPYINLKNPALCPAETNSNKFELSGTVQPEGKVWINGEEAMVDKDGYFTCPLFFHEGENVIKFRVINKFGREKEEECLIRKN
jgi:transcriptional regulator with XRE-family HTH domain